MAGRWENTDPWGFLDVTVFAGDGFYPPAEASFTNLVWEQRGFRHPLSPTTVQRNTLNVLQSYFLQVYVQPEKKTQLESLALLRPLRESISYRYKPVEGLDLDKLVAGFTLICPGISLNTVFPDLHLLEGLTFKEICNRVSVLIQYDDYRFSDVEVVDNKLIQRTGPFSREHMYSSRQTYLPSLWSRTDIVGDTEMISSFIESSDITDVSWIHWRKDRWDEAQVLVSNFKCQTGGRYQCVPSHKYIPRYIWTRYPRPQSGLIM